MEAVDTVGFVTFQHLTDFRSLYSIRRDYELIQPLHDEWANTLPRVLRCL